MNNTLQHKPEEVKNEIKKVIIGKDDVIESVLMAMIAGGHIMLEDIPGVGKTTLALALSKTLSLDYKRMQFTPDAMPGDVTGFMMYNKSSLEISFLSSLKLLSFRSNNELSTEIEFNSLFVSSS